MAPAHSDQLPPVVLKQADQFAHLHFGSGFPGAGKIPGAAGDAIPANQAYRISEFVVSEISIGARFVLRKGTAPGLTKASQVP